MSKVDHLNKVIPDDKLADNFHADQTSQTLRHTFSDLGQFCLIFQLVKSHLFT